VREEVPPDLQPARLKPTIPGRLSVGVPTTIGGISAGSGIASPLTEVSRTTTVRRIWSSDNTIYFDDEIVTELNCLDANGREVKIVLAIPGGSAP